MARGGNGFGANPISWEAIAAYDRLTDAGLRPWEVRAIRAMDGAFLAALSGAVAAKPQRGATVTSATSPVRGSKSQT